MATSQAYGEQELAAAVSSLSITPEVTGTEGVRFKQLSVKQKEGKPEVSCFIERNNTDKIHKLLQSFVSIYDVSNDAELEHLAMGQK